MEDGKLKIFSFFSGCGFLDLGFEKAGYRIEIVNEYSASFMEAYKYARKKMKCPEPEFGYYNCDVNDFLNDKSAELRRLMEYARKGGSLVGFIGGPPCPDFSIAGKQKGRNGDNGKLSLSYVKLIMEQKPDFFLFENVKGLWSRARIPKGHPFTRMLFLCSTVRWTVEGCLLFPSGNFVPVT